MYRADGMLERFSLHTCNCANLRIQNDTISMFLPYWEKNVPHTLFAFSRNTNYQCISLHHFRPSTSYRKKNSVINFFDRVGKEIGVGYTLTCTLILLIIPAV